LGRWRFRGGRRGPDGAGGYARIETPRRGDAKESLLDGT
jgi:hypothetical protein